MDFLIEGISSITWQQIVMYIVGIILIYLAIKKDMEPALLLPIGFGAILVNIPLSGAITQTMQGIGPVTGILDWLFDYGIEQAEALPLLLFIGIGAMIDFGPLLKNPKLLFLERPLSSVFSLPSQRQLPLDLISQMPVPLALSGLRTAPRRFLSRRYFIPNTSGQLPWQHIRTWHWFQSYSRLPLSL